MEETQQHELMNIVIVGHVDHGKSTVIGRLLADTGSLPEGKLQQIRDLCERTSKPFEYAFLLDALKDEQAQGITIEAARVFFASARRRYLIVDAPGHIEFLKNMVTGASRADAALLVIDALEGIRENSRRHGYMLSLLGIRNVAVLVNKMDLVGYAGDVFETIRDEYGRFLWGVEIEPAAFIPVSGAHGDQVVFRSPKLPWYEGPTVLEALDGFPARASEDNLPFRMPVQDVYKFTRFGDNRRIIAGTVASGTLRVGDKVVFHPSGKNALVSSIETFPRPADPELAPVAETAGHAVGFTLAEQIYVTRGEVAAREGEPLPRVARRLKASLFWLSRQPLVPGEHFILRVGTTKVPATLENVLLLIDAATLGSVPEAREIGRHDVAECVLRCERAIAFDLNNEIPETGRFVIIRDYEICGGGIILEALGGEGGLGPMRPSGTSNVAWQEQIVSRDTRERLAGHRGIVLWLTGLSGAGKSTLAYEVERQLVTRGVRTYVLDGDNLRHGLNQDLGFSPRDRDENIRRVAEVAGLFLDAGVVTLVSFISPYRSGREKARALVESGRFIEIYVRCPLALCEQRDPKGLYRKARAGEISEFTGVSAPYEEPQAPELAVETDTESVEEGAARVIAYIESRGLLLCNGSPTD